MVDTTIGTQPAAPWDRTAGWLVPGTEYGTDGANCTWLEYLIVRRSVVDDGTLESPWASNRGPRIDRWTVRAGLTPPVWWCAVWAGAVYRDCGAQVPRDYPATDAWLPTLTMVPRPGAAALYGVRGDAHHIGIVTRVALGMPGRVGKLDVMTREGNRGLAGSASNNGVAVDQGPMSRTDLLGFFHPMAVPRWSIAAFAPAWFLLEHWPSLPATERSAAAAKIRDAFGGAWPA